MRLALQLVGLALALACLLVWWLQWGRHREWDYLWVDGHWYPIELRFGSRWPRVLGAEATMAGKGLLTFAGFPADVDRGLVAHELLHIVDRIRRGFLPYWARILWDILRHPLDHDARPSERVAIVGAPLLLADRVAGVDARTFLRRFR